MKKIHLVLLLVFTISCKHRFYRAPSGSMEETIMRGDNFTVTITGKFERNDIVVFDYYGPDYSSMDETGQFKSSHWERRVYRLIAYSGDSVMIAEGDLFVNNRHIQMPPKGKLRYEVYAKTTIDDFNDEGLIPPNRKGDTLVYTVDLTTNKAEEYRLRKPAIMKVKRILPEPYANDTAFARASGKGEWNINNYGPFKIPSPGEKIYVDDNNLKFYHNIPGIQKGLNTINEKLYFVLGDNRYGAEDSRYIGLIAHSKMYGIVE
ncbi:MAG TPA: S26 family signal peptidase [Chitinophagaceae bacterium]|nr:S26 family signal peptidase [Chitinophagaceae bacterium]